jgi:hypothetical protein
MIRIAFEAVGFGLAMAGMIFLTIVLPVWLAYQAWQIATPLGLLVLIPWLLIMFGGDDGFRGDISPW